MNTNTEQFGSLPSYDVHELVVFTPEDGAGKEIVCTVSGYQAGGSNELLYRLLGNLDQKHYLSDFACLAPHIEDDPDEFELHDYGERGTSSLEDMDFDHIASGAFRGCFD